MREYSQPGIDTAVQRPAHEDQLGGAAARNISRMYTLLPALTFLPLFLLVEGGGGGGGVLIMFTLYSCVKTTEKVHFRGFFCMVKYSKFRRGVSKSFVSPRPYL